MAKRGRLELEDNIYGYYKSIFNHCDVFGQQINRIRWKSTKWLLRRSRLFKVIEVGTNRKPVCDFLLVINSNWQPISYRPGFLSVIFELFFARCYVWGATRAIVCSKIRDFAPTGIGWPKISGRRGPQQPFFFSENKDKWSFAWYENLDWFFFRFVTMHAFVGQMDERTDGRTHRILIARPRLHSMQHGKNK